MLERETKIFEAKLAELVKTDSGNFVLIKEETICGTYVSIADALKAGYEKFKTQSFFVRQIVPAQQPLNFSNNYLLH